LVTFISFLVIFNLPSPLSCIVTVQWKGDVENQGGSLVI